jgi:glutamine synthetase
MMSTDLKTWLSERKIEEVECIVPDMSGVARGKVLPTQKFLRGVENKSLAIPEAIFCLTVTGGYPEETDAFLDPAEKDVVMVPDAETIRVVPWYEEPTARSSRRNLNFIWLPKTPILTTRWNRLSGVPGDRNGHQTPLALMRLTNSTR